MVRASAGLLEFDGISRFVHRLAAACARARDASGVEALAAGRGLEAEFPRAILGMRAGCSDTSTHHICGGCVRYSHHVRGRMKKTNVPGRNGGLTRELQWLGATTPVRMISSTANEAGLLMLTPWAVLS